MRIERRTFLAGVGAATAGLAGCSGGSGSGSGTSTVPGDAAATVAVGPDDSLNFAPEAVTVSTGDAVAWVWKSGGHNVVAESTPDGSDWRGTAGGASETYRGDHVYSYEFTVPGTYEYVCTPHRAYGMTGSVVVEE